LVPEPRSSPVHSAAEDIDIHDATSLESDSGESEASQPTAPTETSNDPADRTTPPAEEADTQLTDTQVAPSSPGNMAIDEIAYPEALDQHSVQTEEASLIPDEWEFDSGEEEMTVEEFIRACCDQKIAALEASAGEMVDAFMKRAESTRERICSLTCFTPSQRFTLASSILQFFSSGQRTSGAPRALDTSIAWPMSGPTSPVLANYRVISHDDGSEEVEAHIEFMELAIQQAQLARPTQSAFNVGSLLVNGRQIIATGFSRELPGNTHAAQCAIAKSKSTHQAHMVQGSVLYSTMEP
ncbi:hypothetical protein IW136_005822, partial [Coemansia sp. RSA 678]